MRFKLVAVALVAALGGGVFVLPAAAQTSNYCGVVASTSGDGTVSTGYVYTAENGRRYCRPIGDPANYVCKVSGTRDVSQTVSYHEDAWYAFREVTKRPVPDASPFKPSGAYDPYAVNTGSLSRPVWQSSGARPTVAEQAAWDAQFAYELIETFAPGETVTTQPTREGYTYRDRMVRVDGELKYRTVTTEVPATVLSDEPCTPDAAAHGRVRYDTLPSTGYVDGRTARQRCDHTALNRGMHDYVCDGDGPMPRTEDVPDGQVIIHETEDGIFRQTCVGTGGSYSCEPAPARPDAPTPTIYTCYAQTYTYTGGGSWTPLVVTPGDPKPYTSTSPCPS